MKTLIAFLLVFLIFFPCAIAEIADTEECMHKHLESSYEKGEEDGMDIFVRENICKDCGVKVSEEVHKFTLDAQRLIISYILVGFIAVTLMLMTKGK